MSLGIGGNSSPGIELRLFPHIHNHAVFASCLYVVCICVYIHMYTYIFIYTLPIHASQSYYAHICIYMVIQSCIIVHVLIYKSIDTLVHIYTPIALYCWLIVLYFHIWPPKLDLISLQSRVSFPF